MVTLCVVSVQLVGTHGQREPLSVNSGDIGTGGNPPPGGSEEVQHHGDDEMAPPETQVYQEEVVCIETKA